MSKKKAIVMLWSQNLKSCDQTTWLISKRTDWILSDLSLLFDSLISSTRHLCSKTPLLSTYYPCNGLVTMTLVIIKSPPIQTLLSCSRKELLFVIKLIKRNACVIRFIKRLLVNQRLTWFGGKARRVNSRLVIPLEMPPLRDERMVSWMQLDLLLGYQH